jgi:CheY-like chemotaxis protein
MMQHHHYSLTELDMMMPWEREIYVSMLLDHIKEENERIEQQNKQNG